MVHGGFPWAPPSLLPRVLEEEVKTMADVRTDQKGLCNYNVQLNRHEEHLETHTSELNEIKILMYTFLIAFTILALIAIVVYVIKRVKTNERKRLLRIIQLKKMEEGEDLTRDISQK